MVRNESLSNLDFATSLAAALTLQGYPSVTDHDSQRLHRAFRDAFYVIKDGLGEEHCRFFIILHRLHGDSGDVYDILGHWLTHWATRDSHGSIWRLTMEKRTAENILDEDVAGGRELWMKAAEAFIKRMNQY